MLLLLITLAIFFAFVPFVARQEKQRESDFKKRKQKILSLGSEFDDVEEEPPVLSQPPRMRTFVSPVDSLREPLSDAPNPYRPPRDT